MPPVDPNNTPAPEQTPAQPPASAPVPEPKKEGFFDKIAGLFKKKTDVSPVLSPRESHTPEPRLDNTAEDVPAGETVPSLATLPENTDPQTGAPQSQELSAPDPNGEVTSPEVAVPPSVSNEPNGEPAPTIPVQPAPAAPQPTSAFQQPFGGVSQPPANNNPVPPQAPSQPAPPVQPPQPVPPSQQPPIPPQQ